MKKNPEKSVPKYKESEEIYSEESDFEESDFEESEEFKKFNEEIKKKYNIDKDTEYDSKYDSKN